MNVKRQNVCILFGGVSAEHEVSIISGLQVLEAIDTTLFKPLPILLDKSGQFSYLPNLTSRSDFKKAKRTPIYFSNVNNKKSIILNGAFSHSIPVDIAFLAFHGGNGESGQVQGLMETLGIPFTSPSLETSSICMNKVLTKQVLLSNNIPMLPYMGILSSDIDADIDISIKAVLDKFQLPVIVKPAHLGSSIGITIAHSEITLKKALLEARFVDSEILIEPALSQFVEYNIAVRKINSNLEVSKIEKPHSHDEILSFADKYQRGGKKTHGMASLSRELPAQISSTLQDQIEVLAKKTYHAVRAKGMVRIDFMRHKELLYVTEINPIPGSLAFYLWEASGIPFKQQITEALLQAVVDQSYAQSHTLQYETDIVDRFISSKRQ